MKLAIGDKILIVAVLAAVTAVTAMKAHSKAPAGGRGFVVYLQDAEFGRYDLSRDGVVQAGAVKLEVAAGSVRVLETNCQRRICQHSVISKPGERIICAPNRLMVEITGGSGVDAVTY